MKYKAIWSEQDKEYVGRCSKWPSLSWLAGSQEAALQGIRDVVAEVVHKTSDRVNGPFVKINCGALP